MKKTEKRADCLVRLRRSVGWLNDDDSEQLMYLCTNQRKRAADVDKPRGAKTEW